MSSRKITMQRKARWGLLLCHCTPCWFFNENNFEILPLFLFILLHVRMVCGFCLFANFKCFFQPIWLKKFSVVWLISHLCADPKDVRWFLVQTLACVMSLFLSFCSKLKKLRKKVKEATIPPHHPTSTGCVVLFIILEEHFCSWVSTRSPHERHKQKGSP